MEFATEFRKYLNKKHPNIQVIDEKVSQIIDHDLIDEFVDSLSDEDRDVLGINAMSNHIQKQAECNLETFKTYLKCHQILKKTQMPEIQKDFADYAKMFVENNGRVGMSENAFLELCRLNGFENEEVIDAFIQYNLDHRDEDYAEEYLAAWQAEKQYIQEKKKQPNVSINNLSRSLKAATENDFEK